MKKPKFKRHLIALLAKWHFFGNPSKNLKIIGVTGTNGKTTVATLLYQVAMGLGYKAGLISTVENIIAGEKEPRPENAPQTTPDPLYLNKLLKKMVNKGCQYVFMEVSSHAIDQGRVNGINFSGGIFTNLTQDHLDYHKNIEGYFKVKKNFFEGLNKKAFALSNVDDEYGDVILDGIQAEKFFYGFGEETEMVDFYGKILKSDFSGVELDFNGEKIKSKLLGTFNAYNLFAVWSVAKLLNFDTEKVNKILEDVKPPKGRFEHFISPKGVTVVVDYAHTPDALEKVLETIQEIRVKSDLPIKEGRIISVFGCGGDRDTGKRPKMGKIGAKLSDVAIFTSDNPRSEDPEEIIEQMKDHLDKEESLKVITISDRRLAIQQAVEMAKEGDIILCAGKGHEEYQEIKGKKSHFSDYEEFKKYERL